ncbi:SGNH/GDSL hydrolase family protein [Gordonia alkanivorans]|uniref:SGNH/GDSL hydrolase family protein n=1 Tax=Gordonia alkanivorans TaxID=84096 RepID=UPI00244699CD|nr:SGNH/GDSL hydrolase family protein [Gordonia alkanivorans]MDH3012553.1 SGNH/GDSL hydrolase family protein [Gordonia alkanivorans]
MVAVALLIFRIEREAAVPIACSKWADGVDHEHQPMIAEQVGPLVYFVGDSYTGGSPMDAGVQWHEYVARDYMWSGRNLGVGLSGYVQRGTNGTTYLDRIESSRLFAADMVVVSGGLNDVRRTPESLIVPAVRSTLCRIRDLAPDVPVAVLSVFAAARDYGISRMNTVLEAEARRIGAAYIDVTDVLEQSAGSVGSDGTHPTDIGHRVLAESIGPMLPRPRGSLAR